jgi:ankyrin repeat protein
MNYLKYVFYLAVSIGISIANAGDVEDLFKAAEIDAPQMVRQALERGADPNARDASGQVALFVALRGESLNAAEALMTHPKLDVDAVNASGETPLMMAAMRGQLAWVQRLLERGAQVRRDGWTPLHYAAAGPSVPTVALLLDRGAAIDARSPNGTTPLMMAARYGAIDAADLLLKRGADPALRNQRELQAVDFATAAGREALAERLRPR